VMFGLSCLCRVREPDPICSTKTSTGAAMFSLIIFITIPVLALALLCGRFTAKSAAEKGRSKRAWFLWGALFFPFFPIQWVVLGLLPKK
jgi:hypothetical protein